MGFLPRSNAFFLSAAEATTFVGRSRLALCNASSHPAPLYRGASNVPLIQTQIALSINRDIHPGKSGFFLSTPAQDIGIINWTTLIS
jgi:hypothetical protein